MSNIFRILLFSQHVKKVFFWVRNPKIAPTSPVPSPLSLRDVSPPRGEQPQPLPEGRGYIARVLRTLNPPKDFVL